MINLDMMPFKVEVAFPEGLIHLIFSKMFLVVEVVVDLEAFLTTSLAALQGVAQTKAEDLIFGKCFYNS